MTKDEALEQPTTTYEQPHGWMQQLVSETDGKKTIRYTFTKTRIGKNDIPIYFEEALEQRDLYSEIKEGFDALKQPTMTYEQGFAHGYEAHRVEQALKEKNHECV